MNSSDYWRLFMDTGAPEAYLMYTKALKTEAANVPEHKGPGAESNGLQ